MKNGNEVKQREWVKPKLERQALKDALAGGTVPTATDVGLYS